MYVQNPEKDQRFRDFHRLNPMVYFNLVRLARRLKSRGAHRIGMKMLFETLRYIHLSRTRGEPFDLNNDFTAYYVRLIERDEPDLQGLFEKRPSSADAAELPTKTKRQEVGT